jgi:hypothetical protein
MNFKSFKQLGEIKVVKKSETIPTDSETTQKQTAYETSSEDNIKTDLQERECNDETWNDLIQILDQW